MWKENETKTKTISGETLMQLKNIRLILIM